MNRPSSRRRGPTGRRRARGLRGITPQQRKFKSAAKKCKGRKRGAFQSCMKRELRSRR